MSIVSFVRASMALGRAPRAICTTGVFAAALAFASPAFAQGGMGGMGGGGMRGGGMGGRGGPGGPGGPGGGRMVSPIDEIRQNVESNDPLKFLLDRKKPLALTGPQRDTLERYRSDMKDAQKPVFKEMEQLVADRPRERDGERGGGRGGARGGRGPGGEPSDSVGAGRGPGGGPFREYANKLMDIQDAFRDRARAQLTATQRATADSLEQSWLAELRKKEEARRERRRN